MSYEKVFQMPMLQLYQVYRQKVERKQRTQDELDVLFWLTGTRNHLNKHTNPNCRSLFRARTRPERTPFFSHWRHLRDSCGKSNGSAHS